MHHGDGRSQNPSNVQHRHMGAVLPAGNVSVSYARNENEVASDWPAGFSAVGRMAIGKLQIR